MSKDKTNTQKVVKGISSQTVITLLIGAIEISSFSIMSRLLTKSDFGYYAAITAIIVIFSSFSETGIGAAIVQCKKLTKQFVDNAFSISLILGIIISGILLGLSKILAKTIADTSMTIPLMLMSITLLLHCLTSVFISIMHRRLEFLRIGTIQFLSLLITTAIAIKLAFDGYGYYAIITKSIMQSLITFFLAAYFCKTHFSFTIDKQTASMIFKFSGWLMGSVFFRNLAHQVDKLLMPQLLSVDALGAYNRPKDFMNQISTKLNGIFDSALFPVLSSIQEEKEKFANAFRLSLCILNTFAMLLALSFALNSDLIIRLFFGEQWINLKFVTIILSFVLVFNIDGRLSDCYLRSLGMTKIQFYFRIFESVLKIVGVCFGYHWGIFGIAISIAITNTFSKFAKIVYIGNQVNISIRETIILIFSSWKFVLLIIPLWMIGSIFLPNNLTGNVILFIYFICLVILIFVFSPHLVGNVYEKNIHSKILSIIKQCGWDFSKQRL